MGCKAGKAGVRCPAPSLAAFGVRIASASSFPHLVILAGGGAQSWLTGGVLLGCPPVHTHSVCLVACVVAAPLWNPPPA